MNRVPCSNVQTRTFRNHGAFKLHFDRRHIAQAPRVAGRNVLTSSACTESLCDHQHHDVKEVFAHLKEHIIRKDELYGVRVLLFTKQGKIGWLDKMLQCNLFNLGAALCLKALIFFHRLLLLYLWTLRADYRPAHCECRNSTFHLCHLPDVGKSFLL